MISTVDPRAAFLKISTAGSRCLEMLEHLRLGLKASTTNVTPSGSPLGQVMLMVPEASETLSRRASFLRLPLLVRFRIANG